MSATVIKKSKLLFKQLRHALSVSSLSPLNQCLSEHEARLVARESQQSCIYPFLLQQCGYSCTQGHIQLFIWVEGSRLRYSYLCIRQLLTRVIFLTKLLLFIGCSLISSESMNFKTHVNKSKTHLISNRVMSAKLYEEEILCNIIKYSLNKLFAYLDLLLITTVN